MAALTGRLDGVLASQAALEAEVAALTDRVATLEASQLAVEAALDETALALADADARLEALEGAGAGESEAMTRLSAVLSVDASGDLALDGVNLWLRSGAGATQSTPNGKGNLILGYGEALGGEARTGSRRPLPRLDRRLGHCVG